MSSDRKQKIDELKSQLAALTEEQRAEDMDAANEYLFKAFEIFFKYNMTSQEIRKQVNDAVESHNFFSTEKTKRDVIRIASNYIKQNAEQKPTAYEKLYTCPRHPLDTHPHNWSLTPSDCPNCECPRE